MTENFNLDTKEGHFMFTVLAAIGALTLILHTAVLPTPWPNCARAFIPVLAALGELRAALARGRRRRPS